MFMKFEKGFDKTGLPQMRIHLMERDAAGDFVEIAMNALQYPLGGERRAKQMLCDWAVAWASHNIKKLKAFKQALETELKKAKATVDAEKTAAR